MAAALVVAALLATSVSSVGSVGAAASPPRGRRRSEGHQRLERGCVRHDHRRRRKDERGSVHVVRVRAGCRLQRRRRHHPAVRALQLEHARGPRGASPQAAAAVAAHDVLLEYFPASQVRLDTCAGGVTRRGSRRSGEEGRASGHGERAADRLIDLRVDDGRNAPITFDVPPAPGVLRPTPPAFASFFDPWMAQVEPLLLDSPSQFRPGPPPTLTSATYTADFNEVKDVGSATSTVRTPEQTATTRFIALASFQLVSSSMQDLAARYELDISDSARLFAAVDMSTADGMIASWDAKLEFGFWRPITAIQLADTDGNPETDPDPTWAPLLPRLLPIPTTPAVSPRSWARPPAP